MTDKNINAISARITDQQKKIILQAGKITGLSICSFVRASALKEARRVIKEHGN